MSSNLTDLEKREREARRNSIYSHPSSVRQREASKRTVGPSHIGAKQADERGAMERRHHAEGKQMAEEQRMEVDKFRAATKPLPADLQKKQKSARENLAANHAEERKKLRESHLRQRDEERRKAK